MAKKKLMGLIVGLAIVMSATFFASCGSAPMTTLQHPTVSYDILGPIDGTYGTYEAALEAAKAAYPDATGVIELVGMLNNTYVLNGKLIAIPKGIGYFAIKFKTVEKKGLFPF